MISFIIILVNNLIIEYNKLELSGDYIDRIKKIVIIYQMDYKEKAINELYLNIDKNKLKETINILKNKFDKKILNTLKIVYNNKKINFKDEKIDFKLINILKSKEKEKKVEKIKNQNISKIINKKIEISLNLKQMNLNEVKKLEVNNIYVNENTSLNSPENYHINYSKTKDINFLNLIKEKFPYYLKYNDL